MTSLGAHFQCKLTLLPTFPWQKHESPIFVKEYPRWRHISYLCCSPRLAHSFYCSSDFSPKTHIHYSTGLPACWVSHLHMLMTSLTWYTQLVLCICEFSIFELNKLSIKEKNWKKKIPERSNKTWICHAQDYWHSISAVLGIVSHLCWAYSLNHVWLFETPCTVTRQVPLSMGFSRVAIPFSRGSSQPRDRAQSSRDDLKYVEVVYRFYANTMPFYSSGFWYLQVGGPGTNPPWIQRDNQTKMKFFCLELPLFLSSLYRLIWSLFFFLWPPFCL